MVDFRPLLFINALAIMLLVTAGFASIKDDVGGALADRSADAVEQTEPVANEVAETTTPSQPATGTPVFADSIDATESMDELQQDPVQTGLASPAFSSPAPAEPFRLDEPAGPVAEADSPNIDNAGEGHTQPEPEPPRVASVTLRSNVYDDQVTINGQSHGSTRLELELEPGRYDVVISKPGYRPWQQKLAVDAGDELTLVAQLEAYTRVDYRNGTWVGGVRTGDGTYDDRDGLRYEGAFVDGQFHGKGTAWYPDGGRYEGDWNMGQREGEGSYRGPDGDTYTGQFAGDRFNGQGTLTRANGDILTGHWVDNRLNGHGSLTTADGMLYVGGFRNDRFHGEGSLTYPDGRAYEGEFSNGAFHGRGSEILASGKKYQGEYVEGKFHGKGLLLNPNGSSIEATFRYGEPYGQVKLTTPEGEIFRARTSEPGVCYRDKSYRATQCPPLEGW